MTEAFCNHNYRYFPGDRFVCEFIFESYRYHNEKVRLNWSGDSPQLMAKPMLGDYELVTKSYDKLAVYYPAGVWDELKMKFESVSLFFMLVSVVILK